MKPLITIVLPTYNGQRFISKSIQSCIDQTFQDWELIIVNDCSTDGTSDIISKFAAQDARIKIISNDNNKKLPASLNIGFRASKGAYLTWTSDDNYYAPDALEKMLSVFKSKTDVDFVYADMYAIREDETICSKKRHHDVCKLYHGCCIGACFLYKSELYEKFGSYNEDMFCAEDYEYWMRLWINNVRFYHLKEYLYYYRNNTASLSATKAKQVQEKTFQLKLLYWDKAPIGRFAKCLALYKPFKKSKDLNMLKQIFRYHPVVGRIVHLIKLKGKI